MREAFDEAKLSNLLAPNEEGHGSRRKALVVIDRADHLSPNTLTAILRYLLDACDQISALVLMRLGGDATGVREFAEFTSEVTANDLRFNTSEVRTLAERAGARLTPADVDAITAQTQGWPALIAAVVAGTPDAHGPNWAQGTHFFDHVWGEQCTAEEKNRDLALSASDHVTEAMALKVLGDLYEPGYLARYDVDGGCPLLPRPVLGEYRSSAFIRAAATKILARDAPELHTRVHSDLSQWHEGRRRFKPALWHAVLSTDKQRLDSVVSKNWPHLFLICPDLLHVALNQLNGSGDEPQPLWRFLSELEHETTALRIGHALLTSTALTNPNRPVTSNERAAEYFVEWGWAQILYGMPTTALYAFWRALGTRNLLVESESRIGISLCLAMLGHIKHSRAWAARYDGTGTPLLDSTVGLLQQVWREDTDPTLDPSGENYREFRARAEAFVGNLVERMYPDAPESLIESAVKMWLDRDPTKVQKPEVAPIDEWERNTLSTLNIPLRCTATPGPKTPVPSDSWIYEQASLTRHLLLGGKYGQVLNLSKEAPIELRLAPRPWLSIVLSRAIALHRLGRPDAAGEALHLAVAISQESSLLSPFSFLAIHELQDVAGTVPQLQEMVAANHIVDEGRSLLTPQQLALLSELARGAPLKTIARRMYLSSSTVKSHLSRIYRELGVSDRKQAIVVAQEQRLLMREHTGHPSAR